ncbi:MAG: hypothetical protein C0508_11115 [Cyanobacteria bacterium PR.023]|jgi:hypothetical protein|nr:hypothetical protein [Cyanobacteria bacterium PR.023]
MNIMATSKAKLYKPQMSALRGVLEMTFEKTGSATADNGAVTSGTKLNYTEISSQKPAKSDTVNRSARDTVAPDDALAELVFNNCSVRPVKPTDTLNSLAKEVLGPKATKESIQECSRMIREINGMQSNRQQELKSIVSPVKNADGSLSFYNRDSCTEKYTYWSDGSMKMENSRTGRGYSCYYQPDGTRVVKSWGPEAADNSVETGYPDRSYKVERSDGTGYVSTVDGKITHWGPSLKDNYTITTDKNGNGQKVELDGTKSACWGDGTQRVQNQDGTGHVSHADGSLESWGPTASHNFKVKLGPNGEKEVTYLDGLKYKEQKNGIVTELRPDGTKVEWKAHQDGSHTVVEVDKHGEISALYISSDAPPNKRHRAINIQDERWGCLNLKADPITKQH